MRPVAIVLTLALSIVAAALSSGCAASARAAVKAPPAGDVGAPAMRPPVERVDRHQQERRREVASDPAAAQATPPLNEELWVIARSQPDRISPVQAAPAVDAPVSGGLLARLPDAQTPVPIPPRHTDVRADIAGDVASVAVTQQFHNPFASKIEAVYVFPLPGGAAVNEFVMTLGDRRIRGVIRDRAEAERIYAAAKAQGYVASLLTQDRPDVFTQSVANIEPGKQIDVRIHYFHAIAYHDGAYEWHFPMSIRSGLLTSLSKSSIPKQRSGRDISLSVHLDAGAKIEQLNTPSHPSICDRDETRADVVLAGADAIANTDFILRYRVAGGRPQAARLAGADHHRAEAALMALANHPILCRLPGWGWMSQTYALASNLVSRPTGFLAVDATRPE